MDPLYAIFPELSTASAKARPRRASSSKHVSAACLQCRSRHIKCEGTKPVCTTCRDKNRPCTYVKSRRGGPRVKGVIKAKVPQDKPMALSADILNNESNNDNDNNNNNKNSNDITNNDISNMSDPTDSIELVNPKLASKRTCFDSLYDPTAWLPDTTLTVIDVRKAINRYYETFHQSHPFLPDQLGPYAESLDTLTFVHDLVSVMDYIGLIINNNSKPPGLKLKRSELHARGLEILTYIRVSPDDIIKIQCLLLLTLAFHLTCYDTLDAVVRQELINLALRLNLNQIDANLSESAPTEESFFSLAPDSRTSKTIMVKVNPNIKQVPVCASTRISVVDNAMLTETCRRTFWEIFTFDVVLGSVFTLKRSRLAIEDAEVAYPSVGKVVSKIGPNDDDNNDNDVALIAPGTGEYTYDTRINSVKLVDDSVKMLSDYFNKMNLVQDDTTNGIIDNDIDNETFHASAEVSFMKLSAQIANWDFKLNTPSSNGMAAIVGLDGQVDTGVQLSKSMLSYTGILLHQPFSYLTLGDDMVMKPAKTSTTKLGSGSVDAELNSNSGSKSESTFDNIKSTFETTTTPSSSSQEVLRPLQLTEHQKLMQTRHTIRAANSVVQMICDLEPSQLYKCSPINSYSLSFAFLVHVNAYVWLSQQSRDNLDEPMPRRVQEERQLYVEYMTIAYRALHLIGQTWHIAAKLKRDIKGVLGKQIPELVPVICDLADENDDDDEEEEVVGVGGEGVQVDNSMNFDSTNSAESESTHDNGGVVNDVVDDVAYTFTNLQHPPVKSPTDRYFEQSPLDFNPMTRTPMGGSYSGMFDLGLNEWPRSPQSVEVPLTKTTTTSSKNTTTVQDQIPLNLPSSSSGMFADFMASLLPAMSHHQVPTSNENENNNKDLDMGIYETGTSGNDTHNNIRQMMSPSPTPDVVALAYDQLMQNQSMLLMNFPLFDNNDNNNEQTTPKTPLTAYSDPYQQYQEYQLQQPEQLELQPQTEENEAFYEMEMQRRKYEFQAAQQQFRQQQYAQQFQNQNQNHDDIQNLNLNLKLQEINYQPKHHELDQFVAARGNSGGEVGEINGNSIKSNPFFLF